MIPICVASGIGEEGGVAVWDWRKGGGGCPDDEVIVLMDTYLS